MELALKVATYVVIAAPTANIHKDIIKTIIEATQSQLVSGSCLAQMFTFFKAAAERKLVDKSHVELLLSSTTLKTQYGAACLAIVIQNDQTHSGVRAHLLTLTQSKNPTNKDT
jgi:hypothetical protein